VPSLWTLPEPWTLKTASTAPWKTTEQVFHSDHRDSFQAFLQNRIESGNLSTKPGQPQCELDR
jgi:hypothetical protein